MLPLGHSASYTCQAISQTACVCDNAKKSYITIRTSCYFRFQIYSGLNKIKKKKQEKDCIQDKVDFNFANVLVVLFYCIL